MFNGHCIKTIKDAGDIYFKNKMHHELVCLTPVLIKACHNSPGAYFKIHLENNWRLPNKAKEACILHPAIPC